MEDEYTRFIEVRIKFESYFLVEVDLINYDHVECCSVNVTRISRKKIIARSFERSIFSLDQ